MAYLPDDILHMVCTELWHQRDFNALFNCACSGKRFATIAVTSLYRVQGVAPITDKDSDQQIPAPGKLGKIHNAHVMKLSQQQVFMKCAGLWRTIVLSSLGQTLYPYSQYIRTLNLRDLEELLTHFQIIVTNQKDFFQGELAQFKVGTWAGTKRRSFFRLDGRETLNRIGEAIMKQTPLLQELTGNVPSRTLSRWIPRLPRLTSLKLWHGAGGEGNGSLIRLHCPSFKRLDLGGGWDGPNSDQDLAAFLNELRPQSLESFEAYLNSTNSYVMPKDIKFGKLGFRSLSCHQESLVELKLNMLLTDTIHEISLLKGFTNLVSLSLAGPPLLPIDLQKWYNDAFLEIVAWLKECKLLRILAITKFLLGPALMVQILLESGIQLTSLEYEGYVTLDTAEFHKALEGQSSLQCLGLKEEHRIVQAACSKESSDALVESLSKLVNLTDLRLTGSSDHFVDRHVMQLARSPPKLEVWSIRGFELTDVIWGELTSLRSLRWLDLGAVTRFTTYGILNFIEKLGPGNKGLVLSIVNLDLSYGVKYQLIQEIMAKMVEGRLGDTSDARNWSENGSETLDLYDSDYGVPEVLSFEEVDTSYTDPDAYSLW